LFLGPTGVGKTETAKVLAKILHGSEDALVRFDLSEFAEPHALARLVGAPPGYVGYDAGGQLTEAVRRKPACILLFDEIEKAHREVLQAFLQILDEGRLTDGRGRTTSFAETIVVMTSNLGADLVRAGRAIGFSKDAAEQEAAAEAAVFDEAKKRLAPELWGRIEEKLVFSPLAVEEVRAVTRRLAEQSSLRLRKERGIHYQLDDRAVDFLVQQGGWDSRLGARPMRQILSRIVEAPIAARILEGRLHADERVLVSTTDRGSLTFLVGEVSLSQRPATMTQLPRRSDR
jgi:ATP-dependent Clp protease ATP-binding subunit ClpC